MVLALDSDKHACAAAGLGEELCGLCGAGYKNGDKWRKVRYIHLHWYNLMESGAVCTASGEALQLLSEWQDKQPYKEWAKRKAQRVSSHFKVLHAPGTCAVPCRAVPRMRVYCARVLVILGHPLAHCLLVSVGVTSIVIAWHSRSASRTLLWQSVSGHSPSKFSCISTACTRSISS
jgi:hypothetical protein